MAPERIPAIKVMLLPKDTNALGTIFGGVILSHIDLASAVEARKAAPHRYVTKSMHEVEFHAPVFVGDIISFFTEHTPANRSVGMMRWNPSTGWTVTNLGHPTGVLCAPAAATENAFSTIVAGYRLTVACTNGTSTLYMASATSETSTDAFSRP